MVMNRPIRIAFYGKGGIGKSTIAANLSALSAGRGKRVLHIGCDPKADASRLLTEKRIPTVLQLLEKKDRLTAEEILFPGVYGIRCVEAGGPEAGSGCAGLGITTAVEELQAANVLEEPWDLIVYDVLGDVVCGGFSVPMRRNFVDRVYVVTSADFMSLYAANNILKGILRYSRGSSLFGGLILNHVRDERDLLIAETFARQTNSRILTWLEEDRRISCADLRKRLFTELYPDAENSRRLKAASDEIMKAEAGELPRPVDQPELELFGERMAEQYGENMD